jgi:hypothetical protein
MYLDTDDCNDVDCHDGDCVDGVDSYTCDCRTGYEGDHCEHSKLIAYRLITSTVYVYCIQDFVFTVICICLPPSTSSTKSCNGTVHTRELVYSSTC